MDMTAFIPKGVLDKYEFHNYGHAAEILVHSCQEEWNDLLDCLEKISISVDDIMQSGGNESQIPKKFDDLLYPRGWREIRITGDLLIKIYPRKNSRNRGKFADTPLEEVRLEGYIDGHNIDFLKNKVAFLMFLKRIVK